MSENQNPWVLSLKSLRKSFPSSSKAAEVEVLKGVDLNLTRGQTLAILGQSGSGKSTLLSLIAGLDAPTSGEVIVNDFKISHMDEDSLARFRSHHLGIVFQQFHLMPHLTALENVSLPLELQRAKQAKARAEAMLEQVGLIARMGHFPAQLSGGESQRVAIARALVVEPALLLADEPTGNLDEATGQKLTDLFFDLVRQKNATMILVTHNRPLAERCLIKTVLRQGKLYEDPR